MPHDQFYRRLCWILLAIAITAFVFGLGHYETPINH